MTTTIDPVSGFSVIPNRETGEATFASDADTWVSEMDSVTSTMNVSIGQINTAGDEIEVNAALAQTAAEAASTSADYQGLWAGKTIAGTVGQSYSHLNYVWRLNVNVADLSTSEPSEANSDWSYANGPLRSDLEVKKPVGSFDESSMSALSIDGLSGISAKNTDEDLGTYTNLNFDVSSQLTAPRDISIDKDGNFWVVGLNSDSVFKYDNSGVYTGTSFSVASEMTDPTGIDIDKDGNFWIVSLSPDSVFKYDSSGIYTGTSFSVAGELSNSTGVAIDSFGNFWVVGDTTDSVFQYDSSGDYTGINFSVLSEMTVPTGISIDSFGNFWIVSLSPDSVFKYDSSGIYQNISFPVSSQMSDPIGISISTESEFWIVGLTTRKCFNYTYEKSSSVTRKESGVDKTILLSTGEKVSIDKELFIREPTSPSQAATLNTVNISSITENDILTDVSGSRSFSTPYQNNLDRVVFVKVGMRATGVNQIELSGMVGELSPTVISDAQRGVSDVGSDIVVSIKLEVPPKHFYEITFSESGTGATTEFWSEL